MRKETKKILIIFLAVLVLVTAVFLPSCKDRIVKVAKIEVVTGSLKDVYALDEAIDYTKAKIKVTFTNGDSEILGITEDMISGFDSSITKENEKMTITYEDKSTVFLYSVTNSVPIQTSFRLNLSKRREETRVVTAEVRAAGLDLSGPIYSIKLTVQCSKDTVINTVSISNSLSGFTKVEKKKNNYEVDIILYSSDGISAIDKDGAILQITATKSSKTGILYVQSVSISDGKKDFSVPNAAPLDIGEK